MNEARDGHEGTEECIDVSAAHTLHIYVWMCTTVPRRCMRSVGGTSAHLATESAVGLCIARPRLDQIQHSAALTSWSTYAEDRMSIGQPGADVW